ncbi:SMI1-KNR4 cell-wall [Seinonella peptonophila]|uniref:SMI1-KNR4 cell-wall n=1 Tax=Seinonella peptonophila TaxID=112248 RepID=A0A1M4Y834_9BACL|nr:SMI1/KNR4 family protein [Seinonella peptonophila]SHF01829.1 SMI1-KNR4 cell-wall [Seinonella peptonophila]
MNWDKTSSNHPQITEELIQTVEHRMQIRFPADYRTIIKENNGARPINQTIQVGTQNEGFDKLMSLHPSDDDYLLIHWEMLQQHHELPRHYVPIAIDSFGNYFCFDFQQDNPSIVFYDQNFELIDPKAIQHVSDSFTQLVEKLQP